MGPRFVSTLIAIGLLAIFAMATTPAGAAQTKPSFKAVSGSTLEPDFDWHVRTYAARCGDDALSLRVRSTNRWRARADGEPPRSGIFDVSAPLGEGQSAKVTFKKLRGGEARHFYVRCLPDDFPGYSFQRLRSGGPKLFFIQLPKQYAAIFDRNGVPVWWFKADGFTDDAKMLPDGTISWDPVDAANYQTGKFDIRSLTGRLIRTVGNSDAVDVHDLQLLPNGDYMVGEQQYRSGIDTSAYWGSDSATVMDIEIQELTPDGDIVSTWDSADHIGLDEAGRWWDSVTGNFIYDIVHWNAVDVDGKFMYLSFRHLDAIYKVNRETGEIVWKLGGTETPESLQVLNDPVGDYPFGGQHDVRVQPDGTITVFNNRTDLADAVPRAERFRIDEDAGTATLLDSIQDPKIDTAFCCGSARRLPSKDWLVAWGYSDIVGAYDSDGKPIFRLRTPDAFTYRANPVAEGQVGAADLRDAMDRMYR